MCVVNSDWGIGIIQKGKQICYPKPDKLTYGLLDENKFVAVGKEESIFQPQWSPDGMLCFVSDRSLWWNIYQVSGITD